MRRSRQVKLVVLGSVALSGCGPDLPDDRYVYNNHTECVDDWGEHNCTHAPSSVGAYCYGPRYNDSVRLPNGNRVWTGTADSPASDPVSGKKLGTRAISRGGFGGLGRSFSSGG